jgi:hypothetical protein
VTSERGPHWASPVLRSIEPVIHSSQHVRTVPERVSQVADWMAYEEFAPPVGASLFDIGSSAERLMDHTMFVNILNFAFTDFATGTKFQVEYEGRTWVDSEAMQASVHRALVEGVPLLDGHFLARITRDELASVFQGNIEIPMLDERIACLHEVGTTLAEKYDGAFHRFVQDCSPRLYDGGNGVLERLVTEFPRFRDVSVHQGHEVQFFKLAQLALWTLHLHLAHRGDWALDDADQLSAFADYIVPVALRVMGILEYLPDLEQRINQGALIARDSAEEIELRAHSIHATALLTDEINARRAGLPTLVVPQVDYRLWKSYHATHWPHHLTKTVMY